MWLINCVLDKWRWHLPQGDYVLLKTRTHLKIISFYFRRTTKLITIGWKLLFTYSKLSIPGFGYLVKIGKDGSTIFNQQLESAVTHNPVHSSSTHLYQLKLIWNLHSSSQEVLGIDQLISQTQLKDSTRLESKLNQRLIGLRSKSQTNGWIWCPIVRGISVNVNYNTWQSIPRTIHTYTRTKTHKHQLSEWCCKTNNRVNQNSNQTWTLELLAWIENGPDPSHIPNHQGQHWPGSWKVIQNANRQIIIMM